MRKKYQPDDFFFRFKKYIIWKTTQTEKKMNLTRESTRGPDTHRDEGRVEDDLHAAPEDVDGGVVDAREALDGLLHRPRTRGARHSGHREHSHLLLLLLRRPLRGLQVAAASSGFTRVTGDRSRPRAPRHGRVPRPQREVAAHLGAAAVEAREEEGSGARRHFYRPRGAMTPVWRSLLGLVLFGLRNCSGRV